MRELPYNPPGYGPPKGSLIPCRPAVKQGSHGLQQKAYIRELAGSAVWLRSLRSTVCVSSRRSHHCWTTSRVNIAPLHFLGGRLPCLLSGRAHRDGHSVCIRSAAIRHDVKTFGFATDGPSLTRQEFAEECDVDVRYSGDAFGPRSTRRFAPHRATLPVSRPFG